jgi:hypothetical protein
MKEKNKDEIMDTKEIYVLFNGEQHLCWFVDKNLAQKTLDENQDNVCFPELTVLGVQTHLYEQLDALKQAGSNINPHFNVKKVPQSYFIKEQSKEIKEWKKKEGFRMYIIFEKNGRGYFSPSGNNLATFHRASPDSYLCEPLRVELSQANESRVLACFEWACDNF